LGLVCLGSRGVETICARALTRRSGGGSRLPSLGKRGGIVEAAA